MTKKIRRLLWTAPFLIYLVLINQPKKLNCLKFCFLYVKQDCAHSSKSIVPGKKQVAILKNGKIMSTQLLNALPSMCNEHTGRTVNDVFFYPCCCGMLPARIQLISKKYQTYCNASIFPPISLFLRTYAAACLEKSHH